MSNFTILPCRCVTGSKKFTIDGLYIKQYTHNYVKSM